MPNFLTRKLEQFARFSHAERDCLDVLAGKRHSSYVAGEVIVKEGQKPDFVHLVVSGLVASSKLLSSGRRQIMAFLVPGDLCDLEVLVLDRTDHDLVALTDAVVAHIAIGEIEPLFQQMSSLTRALWWSMMTDQAVLRERIIDLGARTARERICHILYEMLVRYRVVGLADESGFAFPITQEQLAEATGISPVHVNRVMSELRAEGLVHWRHKTIAIPDRHRLKQAARFEAGYLHLSRTAYGDSGMVQRAYDL